MIHFLSIYDGGELQGKEYMGLILAHETAHTLGMDDVYNSIHFSSLEDYCCIMQGYDYEFADIFYWSIVAEDCSPFCGLCQGILNGCV